MNKISKRRTGVLTIILLMIGFTMSAQELQFPVIQSYGGVALFETAGMPTKGGKLLIDLTTGSTTKQGINKGWERVARTINLYALSDVPVEELEIVVIVHGEATKTILSDEAYRSLFDMENPNSNVIEVLKDAGVKIMVCSQAILHRGFKEEQVFPFVGMALSAITYSVSYQQQGFIPLYF